MKIEHVFTEAAEKLLVEEQRRLCDALRAEAVNEAFRSRGKPVEVTASDVSRAAARLGHEEIGLIEHYPSTIRLLRAYFWIGIVFLAIGVTGYLVGSLAVPDVVPRVYLRVFILVGLGLVVIGLVMRFFLRAKLLRHEERSD